MLSSTLVPLALLCGACASPSCEIWAPLVQEYRAAQAAGTAAGPDAETSVSEAILERNAAARAALAKAAGPARAEIVRLLESDEACRDCALVFVVAKGISDEEVAAAVLSRYRADHPYALRADTFIYLSSVLDTRRRVERAALVERILCSETDPGLLAIAASRIDEFPAPAAAHIYACYLNRGPTIQYIARRLLEGAGGEVRALVREHLASEGTRDAPPRTSGGDAAEDR